MKKCLLILLLILGGGGMAGLRAVPAWPYPVEIRLPDGTSLTVRIHGDEYFSYKTTGDGYVIARAEDGFFYYASVDESGSLHPGELRAHNPGERDAAERAALAFCPKGIPATLTGRMRQKLRMASQPYLRMGTTFPVTGSPRSLVLLVSFSDLEFSWSAADFDAMLNAPGYAADGATGSARDYYSDNSGGRFTPEFVVFGPVKLTRPMSYYGRNEGNDHHLHASDMVVDACRAADNAGLDFSQFDMDGDGVIDNIFIYYAGYNEAEGGPEESVWPHRSAVAGNAAFDGKRLQGYACSSELKGNQGKRMAAIGTLCHEFAHVLGLPDLYDTDGDTDGRSWGVYNFSLMCTGNYNDGSRTPPYLNVVERSLLGWLEPEELTTAGPYSLEAVGRNKGCYYTTEMKGEVFMLENRQPEKWDAALPGHGLLIYHVDRSDRMVGNLLAKSRWELQNNNVNNVAAHPCLRLMDASGDAVPGQQGSGMMFFPGTLGKTAFTAETTPSSRPWSGMDLERNLTGIREEGGLISFVYSGGGNVAVEGVTLNPADLHIDLLDSVQLVADVIPSNALDKTCDWYSSDRNVVTVNERGVVKAWAPGNADIKVSTRNGGFEATCHVTVIQNMAENRPLRIGQREIWLNWKKLKEMDRWLVEWKKASAAEYTVAGVVDSVYLIRGLQPATRYKVRLAGEKQGEVAVVMEQEVVTGEITAPFAAIGWIKGSYVTGEALEMGLVNVQADVVGEEWTVDGKEIPIDRKLILPVGEHVVKVRFKDKKGNEETIVRKIVIHD